MECEEKEVGDRHLEIQTFGLGGEFYIWGCAYPSCTLVFFICSPERELDPGKPQNALEKPAAGTGAGPQDLCVECVYRAEEVPRTMERDFRFQSSSS